MTNILIFFIGIIIVALIGIFFTIVGGKKHSARG